MGEVIQAAHRFFRSFRCSYRLPPELLGMPPLKRKRGRPRKFRFARPERSIDWGSPLLLTFHDPVPPTIDLREDPLSLQAKILQVESVPVIWGKPPLKWD